MRQEAVVKVCDLLLRQSRCRCLFLHIVLLRAGARLTVEEHINVLLLRLIFLAPLSLQEATWDLDRLGKLFPLGLRAEMFVCAADLMLLDVVPCGKRVLNIDEGLVLGIWLSCDIDCGVV
jgi:hypothetical protein